MTEVKPYLRRSARLPLRFPVTLRWEDLEGSEREEIADTLLVSRHGGLLVSSTSFKPGDNAFLWWLERRKGAAIRFVTREQSGTHTLIELGFEFADAENFWEIEFPPDDRDSSSEQ